MSIILVIAGFILLVKGADFLVDGASSIAKRFHISEIIIGLTVVAIGTSMPELVVSVTSALEGHSDISIGNVIGSNIANMFLILGICSIIKPLEFKKQTRVIENPFVLVITLVLFVLCNNGKGDTAHIITRIEGIILLSVCVLYIAYTIVMAKFGTQLGFEVDEDVENIESMNVVKAIIYIILGIIGLKFGGDFVVKGCVSIAKIFGISEDIISLTIVAIGTSLPELVTSITATRKNETDMAIGNIIGSNIFNIILILGTSSVISTISYSSGYNKYMIVLIIGTIMLNMYPFVGVKDKMTRRDGIPFVFIYTLYIISMVIFK